jgi:hypothetical protein
MSTELEVLASVGNRLHRVRCTLCTEIRCVLREGRILECDACRAFIGTDPCTQLEAFVKDGFSVLEGCVLGVT